MTTRRRARGASLLTATTGLIALVTLGAATPAQAATQTITNPSDHVATCEIGGGTSLGQWFISPTPADGTLTKVGFNIANAEAYDNATLTISEGIGNENAPVRTQNVSFPATPSAEEAPIVFELDDPVPVVPGGTYSVQVNVPDECPFVFFTGEPYPEGTMLRNGNQVSGDLAFTLEFETPEGTPATIGGQPPAGVVGTAYSYAFGIGGTPPVTVTASGDLPPGLSLSDAGVLSGTPTTPGTYNFAVSARNEYGGSFVTFEMQVNPATKPKADVALSLTAPASVKKGHTFVYAAVVTNKGPSTASSVTTDLVLPPGVKFVSASAPVTRSGSIVSWPVKDLANGQVQELKITVTATKSGTQIAGGGALRLGTPDPKLLNNVAAASTKVK